MMRLIFAVTACLTFWLVPVGASAQDAVITDPSANDLHEFTRLLADERIQNWIATQADDADLADTTRSQTLRDQLVGVLDQTRTRMGDIAQAWQVLPTTPGLFAEQWRTKLNSGKQVRGLTFVMIFLFVGAGLEWLFRQYTNALKLRIELHPVETIRGRIGAACLRALIALAGLAIFALGSIGAFAAFDWPPALEGFVLNLLVVIFSVRAIHSVLVLFLAPSVQELRLLPLGNRFARNLSRVLLCLTGLLVLAASLSGTFPRVTGVALDSAHALGVRLVLAAVALVATYIAIFVTFRWAKPLSKPARMWRLYLAVLATLAFGALVLGQVALMWTLVLVGLLIPSLRLLRVWVDGAFERAQPPEPAVVLPLTEEADAQIEFIEEPSSLPHPYESYRPIAQRLVRFIALFGVGIAIALIWDLRVFERAASPTLAGKTVALLIDSAVALLIADLVWVWASSAIDRRLDAYQPPEPGTAPGPEARMATLLPLLRVTLMITLLAMVAMSILTSLGVNVAPLLAGAGVVGVAIGFGAQSLVKDVVSGIFFLIDDAFRAGEYVEIDNLRGTVERISIRSLQIRHHRGAVHTLPFGELRHLTNHSRDWVIMKLEFRVPFDTDLKLVKKLIKTIGTQLKENEEYGASILETLKSQGVRRMEEFNMVVGVKFMTRPGEQWLVRRDAYQMVRDAFDANGIRMAERNVKVEVAGSDTMTDADRQAVAGAAQQAIERQIGPGAPIPDEP